MRTALWHQQRSFQIVTTANTKNSTMRCWVIEKSSNELTKYICLILRWWYLWRPFQLAQLCVVIKSSFWERRFFDLNLANPAVANVRREMCKMFRVYVWLCHLQWTKEQVTLYCSDCSSSSEVFLTSSECFMGVAQGNASVSVTAAFQLSQRRWTKVLGHSLPRNDCVKFDVAEPWNHVGQFFHYRSHQHHSGWNIMDCSLRCDHVVSWAFISTLS